MLILEGVSVRYGDRLALAEATMHVRPGEWWMILGPNGAGKSTLLSAAAQSVPYTGRITICGKDARAYKPRELARQVGALEQRHQAGYAFTAREIVSLGRYAYREGFFKSQDAEGEEKIRSALQTTGLADFADRSVLTLSGGETQRVFLAQALAQDPALLLLDEPVNHLDLIYQQQLFSLIGEWLRRPGRAVVSVVHDLLLARHFGTHALLLSGGRTMAAGEIQTVMTRENLREVYGMDVYAWLRTALEEWTER